MPPVSIPVQGFAHVKGILSGPSSLSSSSLLLPLLVPVPVLPVLLPHLGPLPLILLLVLLPRIQIITVIAHDAPIDAVAHLPIHVDGGPVTLAHVQVDEPGGRGVAGLLEGAGEQLRVPVASVRGGDGQDGDVAVPGEGGREGGGDVGLGGGLEFAHDFGGG